MVAREAVVDVAVVGAGIVGLATARALLLRRPDLRVAVLEKEARVGALLFARAPGTAPGRHSGSRALTRPWIARAPVARPHALTAAARHQSSHSSNVVHSGIYYAPGSARARLCVRGLDLMYAYCDAKRIPYDVCGKVGIGRDEGRGTGPWTTRASPREITKPGRAGTGRTTHRAHPPRPSMR